ncbi:hypothetical protein [Mycobacterium sp.]|uniref:hypothetical protein n=1 Tax=Mycobacterium sp. TaxID=1785 RepID=UPI003C795D96
MSYQTPQRAILAGLGAAAGAFGAAAMMSAAGAPTAHADDFTDTIAIVEGDLADGQTAFTTAFTDFGSNLLPDGTAQFFNGVDDDLLLAPANFLAGTVEGLTNETFDLGTGSFTLSNPYTFAEGFGLGINDFQAGLGELSFAGTKLIEGDFGDATYDAVIGAGLTGIVSPEEFLLGSFFSPLAPG